MAQNMKMGKAKGSRKLAQQVRKENRPYYGKRRADANQSGASSSHMLPPHTMADSSDDESLVASSTGRPLSSRPSWHLSSREIKCEISGVTPLPEDEQDGDNALSTAPAVRQATSGSSQAAPTSKTMLKRSKRKHFVTPAPQKMPAAACGMVPKAPKVLGNSQRQNCLTSCHGDHPPSFLGLLTPPHRDDVHSTLLSPSGPDYFQSVADEVLLHIFRYLSRRSLARCMRVCKKWFRVICDESLWRRIDLSQKRVAPNTIRQLITRGTTHLRLARADICGKRIADLNSSFTEELRLSRLQYLDLSMGMVSASMLSDILSHCRQLRKISLENVPVNDTILHLLSENPSLDTLNLTMCQGVTSSGLIPLFAHCTVLRELNLGWCGLKRSCVSYVCGAVPTSVQHLNLSGCREALTDEDVERLCSRCESLVELDLSDSLNLTFSSIDTICRSLLRLECLSLSRCYNIPPTYISFLGALPRLQHLNVIGMLAKEPFEELKAELPRIQLNSLPFSTVARPTTGQRRTSIWGQRVREEVL